MNKEIKSDQPTDWKIIVSIILSIPSFVSALGFAIVIFGTISIVITLQHYI